jgi:hypothetical protein
MSDSARQAVVIKSELSRPAGDLPALAEVDAGIAKLRALAIADQADAIVVRDTLAGLTQIRNAAEIAGRRRA